MATSLVVDREGIIRFAGADPDYTRRPEQASQGLPPRFPLNAGRFETVNEASTRRLAWGREKKHEGNSMREKTMSERSDGHDTRGLKRREFLSVGALPLAAALGTVKLGTVKLGTVKLGSPEKMGSTPSAQSIIRIGLIGAGANVRRVQIPAFRRIPECEIMAVANRSLESSQRVADEFNIPRAYGSWGELLDDDSVRTIGVQVYVRPAYGWAYLSPELP